MGAALSVKGVEIGAIQASKVQQPGENAVGIYPDDGARQADRDNGYKESRGVMLAHTISRSGAEDQLYDITIYLVPHLRIENHDSDQIGNLLQVTRVEYFFGGAWGNRVFSSITRNNGFAVTATAYGPFLCTAKVFLNDGKSVMLYRYIDFEMGNYAPPSSKPIDQEKEKSPH